MNNQNRFSRRDALRSAALTGTASLLAGRVALAQTVAATRESERPPAEPGRDYLPVITPNGWTLPFTIVDGAKVFHLVAEEVEHEFAPGLVAHCWGYNGSVHGPTIEAVEGDRVRIFVTNRLAAATTVHWHGVITPSGMDGVGGVNQKPIEPGETYIYEFTLRQHGTFMYHSHHDEMTQMAMGMVGLFVIHPREVPAEGRVDRDFAIQLHEWAIPVGTDRPNPNEMTDFNVLTMNARAFPGTAPLVVKRGDRVRIRFGNLSAMDHHPIHLHGYAFTITSTDGGDVPASARFPETTVLVGVGQTRTIEFVADNPGDFVMHCHMTHHMMNQMGHEVPNMTGVEVGNLDKQIRPLLPGYMTMGETGMAGMAMGMKVPPNSIPMVGGTGPFGEITMGGMFTILKVRESLPSGYDVDPGWYEAPAGTAAWLAKEDELRRNAIDVSHAPRRGAPPQAASAPTSRPASAPAAVVYGCPMHPEVTSKEPGTCHKCGMKLVARK